MGLLDSSAKSGSFVEKGQKYAGTVTADGTERQQKDYDSDLPLFWTASGKRTTENTGEPVLQYVVTVDTGVIDPTVPDDDGWRAIFFKGQMLAALKAELRKVRAAKNGVLEGDFLSVEWFDEKPTTNANGKPGVPQKIYRVEYKKGPGHDAAGQAALEKLAGQHDRNAAARPLDDEPPF